MRRLILTVLVAAIGCTSPKGETAAKFPDPFDPTDVSIGATVQASAIAMRKWADLTATYPDCSEFVTKRCITAEERSRFTVALKNYRTARAEAAGTPDVALSASDTRPAPLGYLKASLELVAAADDASKRSR